MRPVKAALCGIFWGTTALAQQPLSAIEWLDDVIAAPLTQPPQGPPAEPPVTQTALIPDVSVMPISPAPPDAAGLLPSSTTGLPRTLWSASKTDDLLRQLAHLSHNPLPAIQALYYTVLLAEADAPPDTDNGARFLIARIQSLTSFGAVEPARALLERAGPEHPLLFDQWLDLSLLSGVEDEACRVLRDQPALSDHYAARIFCIARAGDWSTAALTYETAVALDYLTATQTVLLAQFLDPETIEDTDIPASSKTLSPLVFRLYESVGNPRPTRHLPRAFAMADLRGTSGWKAEIEAAERLTQTGALPANHLLGLYTARRPAASGGVWDRVRAIQDLDNALKAKDLSKITETLPNAWNAMKSQNLEVAFAQLFAHSLRQIDLPRSEQELSFLITLLSPEYETAADILTEPTTQQKFLIGLAQGTPDATLASTATERAITGGFTAEGPATGYDTQLKAGKLGQTILAAATRFDQASTGNLRDLTDTLSTLRSIGLEDTARRAALQLLILGAQ